VRRGSVAGLFAGLQKPVWGGPKEVAIAASTQLAGWAVACDAFAAAVVSAFAAAAATAAVQRWLLGNQRPGFCDALKRAATWPCLGAARGMELEDCGHFHLDQPNQVAALLVEPEGGHLPRGSRNVLWFSHRGARNAL